MNREEMFNCEAADILIHVKTGNRYIMQKAFKLKLNGSWDYGVLYRNKQGEEFCRHIDDFNGFKQLTNK